MGETARFFFLPSGGQDKILDKIDESDQKVADTLEGHVKQLRALRAKLKGRKLKRRCRKSTEELPPLNLLPDLPDGDPAPAE